MYKYHFDFVGQQWNVYKLVNGQEQYVCSFTTLLETQAFVDSANKVEVE